MPIDNLSKDKKGDIYGAGFPNAMAFVKTAGNPWKYSSPTTVWRLRKGVDEKGAAGEDVRGQEGYVMEKVVEDKTGKLLGGATVAVHDAKTGRIFTGGEHYLSLPLLSAFLVARRRHGL